MYGCESLTIKKAEHQRIDAFELWCWRRLLAVPWTARRSYQAILKEISPEDSLEGLMLKLKLWPPGVKNWLIGKDPDAGEDLRAGGEGDNRGWDGWMASLTRWAWVWVISGGWWMGGLGCCSSWSHKESDTTEWLNWTELNLPLVLKTHSVFPLVCLRTLLTSCSWVTNFSFFLLLQYTNFLLYLYLKEKKEIFVGTIPHPV